MPEIWIVNQYAISPDMPGGTRHYDLAVELQSRGFRVRIFATDFHLALRKQLKLRPDELYKVEERDGVQFIWVRSAEHTANSWRRFWNMISFARNVCAVAGSIGRLDPPNVVIGSSPQPFAALAAQWVARRFGARFILELRDLWPQALVDMGGLPSWHPAVQAMRLLEKYLYPRAERIITLARGSEGYLRQRGVQAERIVFLPNGVHLGHFVAQLNRAEARAKYGFSEFTVVYAGAHGPANSLETVVRAGEQLRDHPIRFVLIGDGSAKPRLQQLARELAVGNICFMDPIPKAEIPDLLMAADAGVITLKDAHAFRYGVSPNKLFDYMAAGLPVLCAVAGDMAEMVAEAGAGLTSPPEDASALARSIMDLAAMPNEERRQLGRNGREYLTQHYRREVLSERLAEVLANPVG